MMAPVRRFHSNGVFRFSVPYNQVKSCAFQKQMPIIKQCVPDLSITRRERFRMIENYCFNLGDSLTFCFTLRWSMKQIFLSHLVLTNI